MTFIIDSLLLAFKGVLVLVFGLVFLVALIQTVGFYYDLLRYRSLTFVDDDEEGEDASETLYLGKDTKRIVVFLLQHLAMTVGVGVFMIFMVFGFKFFEASETICHVVP